MSNSSNEGLRLTVIGKAIRGLSVKCARYHIFIGDKRGTEVVK